MAPSRRFARPETVERPHDAGELRALSQDARTAVALSTYVRQVERRGVSQTESARETPPLHVEWRRESRCAR